MEIDPNNLPSGRDNRDRLREKALRIRLDRTTVNGHVWKAERSVVIRDFGSGRPVAPTSQNHASSIASPCGSIGSRQGHGANNRRARTDDGGGRRRNKRA